MKNYLIHYLSIAVCLIISSGLNAQGTCITGSNVASEGSFSVGYKVTYETLAGGTPTTRDVVITYELYDTDKDGLEAFLQQEAPFEESSLNFVSGQIWNTTLTNQTDGAILSYRCKFAFAGGLANTSYIQYEVGTDCSGTTNDVIEPDTFTASVGASTAFSVELLVNANDASGIVVYNVGYDGITKTISAPAGIEKSFLIAGLTADTAYNFSVSASDLSGNFATNNPIPLAASTTVDTSTACAGTSDVASNGSFQIGYNYEFETQPNGTDVKFTFELLDDRPYGLAFLHREEPFLETGPLTEVSPKVFSVTLAQTPGAIISYAFKIEFSPGLAITKYFSYLVGDDCSLSIDDNSIDIFRVYPNPTKNIWTVKSNSQNIQSIIIYDILGKQVISLKPNSNNTVIDASNLSDGLYFAKIKAKDGEVNIRLVKN